MKKILLFLLLVLCISTTSLLAQEEEGSLETTAAETHQQGVDAAASDEETDEEDEEWFLGMPITSFKYQGLVNISSRSLDRELSDYVDQEFTYDLLSDIQDSVYNMEDSFSSVEPMADRDEEGNLVIILVLKEIPRIRNIIFENAIALSSREMRKALTMKEKGPFYESEIHQGKEELIKRYKEEGFREVEVSVRYTEVENNSIDVVYSIIEGKQSHIASFEFQGNYTYASSDLIDIMSDVDNTLEVSGYYQDEHLENNIEALRKFYAKNGFVDVDVAVLDLEDISQNLEEEGHQFKITFQITEGRQWKISQIVLNGVNKLSEESLRKHITLKSGDNVDFEKINAEYELISGDYYDHGYIYSSFSRADERNENNATIKIVFNINEGVQAMVEDIKVSGNVKTKDYVFLREVTLKKGDIFARSQLIKSLQNIYNTTLVSDVNYSLAPGKEEGSVIVDFIVTESKQMDLTFGLTFGGDNTGFPISFLASISDKNLVGKAMKLTAGVQLTTDYQAVNFSWNNGWVGDKRWSNGVSFQFEHSHKNDILQRAPGQDFLFGRNQAYPYGYNSYAEWQARKEALPGSKYLMSYDMYRFSVGYNTGYTWTFDQGRLSLSGGVSFGINRATYDENSFTPYEYLIYKYNQAWQWSNSLSFSVSWDGRDFVENTTGGYLLSQSFTYAGGILGGLSNYMKSNTSASGYVSLFKVGDGIKPRALVLSLTSNLGLMIPQWWKCDVDKGRSTGWQWHDPKYGATRNEMLYIDGMMISRGTDSVYDLAFLWDNMLELSFPIVVGIINVEAFTSLTAAAPELSASKKLDLTWYGAIGLGVRLKISGFPLGLYLVGNYSFADNQALEWKTGGIFNYIRPVLSISMSLF